MDQSTLPIFLHSFLFNQQPGTSNELTKPLSKLLSEEEIISMVRLLNELYNRYPQFPPEYYEKLKIVQQGFLVSRTVHHL